MPPRPRGNGGRRGPLPSEGLRSNAGPSTSRRSARRSNPQKTPSISAQGTTIIIEDTTSDIMSIESEFSTDDYSSENGMSTNSGSSADAYSSDHDTSSSDSEDKIVRTKARPMINLPPGRYITRSIPGNFNSDELSSACVWGNTITLYREHITHLRQLIKAKKTSISYHVCRLNKTFAAPTQRMYFKNSFSKTYLLAHMPQKNNVLPITSGDRSVHVSARLIKGVDGRVTITSGWKPFIIHAELTEGSIYAFGFKSTTSGLRLTVHAI